MSLRIRRWLSHNPFWKLGSLATAILLWYFMVGAPEQITLESVPLAYRNLRPELVLSSVLPDSVRVELSGRARYLTRQNLDRLRVLFDLGNVYEAGSITRTVSEADLNLPSGIAFLSAVPSQLRLSFDRLTVREVPVSIVTEGAPPDGHYVVKQEVMPERVSIAGPQARVNALSAAPTEPIDLTGNTGITEYRVSVSLADSRLDLRSSGEVRVRITVEKGSSQTGK
jgi:YbbR domain-containing protein